MDDALRKFGEACKAGKRRSDHRIGFETPELLWKVLTQKRWKILKSMVFPYDAIHVDFTLEAA